MADAYANWYESLGDAMPTSYREATYRDRLATAFPFHPELVDILTNRWGLLSGFQRTRGALRTLAHTVKALGRRRHAGTLIHPGDMDLADPGIRGEVLRFAGESYKAALNADIIRRDAKAPEEDHRRGGQVEQLRLATGLAKTAFLNSFGSDEAEPPSGLLALLLGLAGHGAYTIATAATAHQGAIPAAGSAGGSRWVSASDPLQASPAGRTGRAGAGPVASRPPDGFAGAPGAFGGSRPPAASGGNGGRRGAGGGMGKALTDAGDGAQALPLLETANTLAGGASADRRLPPPLQGDAGEPGERGRLPPSAGSLRSGTQPG